MVLTVMGLGLRLGGYLVLGELLKLGGVCLSRWRVGMVWLTLQAFHCFAL
jgi:hypothetical protein